MRVLDALESESYCIAPYDLELTEIHLKVGVKWAYHHTHLPLVLTKVSILSWDACVAREK